MTDELQAVRDRDTESGATWFTGPASFTAQGARDRRYLLAKLDETVREYSAIKMSLWRERDAEREYAVEGRRIVLSLARICDQVGELTCITNEHRTCNDPTGQPNGTCTHHVCAANGCLWKQMDDARVFLRNGPQCPKAGESGSKPDCARFDSSGVRQNEYEISTMPDMQECGVCKARRFGSGPWIPSPDTEKCQCDDALGQSCPKCHPLGAEAFPEALMSVPGRRTEWEYAVMGRPQGWRWLDDVKLWARNDDPATCHAIGTMRDCMCGDPENCKEPVPGFRCRMGDVPSQSTVKP